MGWCRYCLTLGPAGPETLRCVSNQNSYKLLISYLMRLKLLVLYMVRSLTQILLPHLLNHQHHSTTHQHLITTWRGTHKINPQCPQLKIIIQESLKLVRMLILSNMGDTRAYYSNTFKSGYANFLLDKA